MQILVFGDSIVYGFWDKEDGWVARLRKYLEQKTWVSDSNWYVYNLGIAGDTSRDVLNRFDLEAKVRLNPPTIFIFALGINDSYFLHKENRINVSVADFKNNLQKLITSAKKYSGNIVFLGLTPVEQNKVDPMPWSLNESYRNADIKKYNEIIKSVCHDNKIYFIDLFEEWKELDYKKWLEDGAHPNSTGHEKIFEKVKKFLKNKKLI